MILKTIISLCVLALASCLSTAAVAQAPQKPLDKVSMRYSFAATGADTVWTYGIEKGFFRDVGIDLELREGKGSAVTAQTVAAGTDDFGIDIDAGTFLALAAKGLPATAVMSNVGKNPNVILSPAAKPIKSPADMVGKKIAIAGGGGSAALLPVLVRRNNIDANLVTLINMQANPLLTSLLGGQVDGVATNIVVKASLEAKGLPVYAMLYGDFGITTPGMYLMTSNALLNSKSDLVKRMVAAAQKSMIATVENPEAAAASFVRYYTNYDQKSALAESLLLIEIFQSASTKGKAPLGTVSVQDAQEGAKILAAAGMMAPGVDASKYITNDFVTATGVK
jgi:NitT/TauT family transport system substrate-binding protein